MPTISTQQRLKAYYKATLAIFFLGLGAVGLAISIWLAGGISPWSPLCVLLCVFGFYCLNRPYFVLEPRQLTVYNLLGLVSKRYTFDSWDVVKADSRRIYIDDDGITKKVPIAPWLVKADDWMTMRKML